MIKILIALAAIVLAAAGQYLRTYYHADLVALVLFFLAIIVWCGILFSTRVGISRFTRAPNPIEPSPHRVPKLLALCAILLSIFTFAFASGNQLGIDNLLAWFGSIIAFLYSFAQYNPDRWAQWWREKFSNVGSIFPRAIILVAITLLGAFLYLYKIDTLPAPDDRYLGRLLAVDNIVNASYAPFFVDQTTGGEPLQFYLTAAVAKIADQPIDPLMLKVVSAMVGIALIPLIFFLAREFFCADVALVAAFLLAISKWNITLARAGFHFIFAPVFVTLVMFFVARAFKYHTRNDFLLAGFFLGAGVYSYSVFRIVPILVLLCAILWLVRVIQLRANIRQYLANCAILFTMAIIIVMPLIRYVTEKPAQIITPMSTLIVDPKLTTDNPIKNLGTNLIGAATMFNWTADTNPLDAVPNDPALDYVTGALFLLGVVYAMYALAHFRQASFAFLLIGVIVLILPSAMDLAHPFNNPSIERAAGAMPFVFILAALPLAWLVQSIRAAIPSLTVSRLITIVLLIVLLAISLRANYLRYFRDYAAYHQQTSSMSLRGALLATKQSPKSSGIASLLRGSQ